LIVLKRVDHFVGIALDGTIFGSVDIEGRFLAAI